MTSNCDVIAIFPIYGQFGAIGKPISGRIVSKTYIFFYLTKTESRTKKSLTQHSHYCFEYRFYFGEKNSDFFQKSADIFKTKTDLVLTGIFSETTYKCVFTCQISRFYYNSNEFYTGWGNFTLPLHLSPQNEPLEIELKLNWKPEDVINQKVKPKIITYHQWKKPLRPTHWLWNKTVWRN